jgi:hypothetical protein
MGRFRIFRVLFSLGALAGIVCNAAALDLPTLDKVSVMMSRDQVRYIAGQPDEAVQLAADLMLETWRMTNAPGMIAAGGIFDRRNALIALAYVFAGATGELALNTLRELGFAVETGVDGVTRLRGPDDDTGRPLIVVIDERPPTTTVFAYDEREYETRSAAGPLPSGPGIPVAIIPSASAAPRPSSMDPAVTSALAAGIGILGGQMKPFQKSTTISSSSSTTPNADGSITTRGSSTSVGVSVDPVGLTNALMTLFK